MVQVIFLLRLLAGWALTVTWPWIPTPGSVVRLACGVTAWFCTVMAIYLLNGVADVREDRINASRRPIAQGLLAPEVAARTVWVLIALGVVAGLVTSVWLGLLTLLLFAMGWWYSVPGWRLKRRTPGVALAALFGVALSYYAGAVVAAGGGWPVPGPPRPGVELLVFGGSLGLWAALVGGTTKDLPDVAGDEAAGTRGWLTIWGEQRFRTVVAVVALLIGTGFVAAAVGLTPPLLPPAVVLLVGAVAVAVLLAPGNSGGTRAARRRPYLGFMVTQYIAHGVIAAGIVSEYSAPVGNPEESCSDGR